jgi:hypothetical protein
VARWRSSRGFTGWLGAPAWKPQASTGFANGPAPYPRIVIDPVEPRLRTAGVSGPAMPCKDTLESGAAHRALPRYRLGSMPPVGSIEDRSGDRVAAGLC